MNYHLNVMNIKSDGCVNTICSTLDALDGVHETVVNITNGTVIVDANRGLHDVLSTTLLDLGYPQVVESKIQNTFSTRAKSIFSCVKGRLHIA